MLRLAADSCARRGEIAAFRIDDLVDRRLHIARALSRGQVTTPKSGHGRTITLGADTATLWHRLHATWVDRLARPAPQPSPKKHAATNSPDRCIA